MGIFNKETFLQQRTDGAGSTQRLLVPEGVRLAVITEVDVKNGEKDGKEWAQLSVQFTFEDVEVKEAVKRDAAKLTDYMFLQLTDMGTLSEEEGDNVPLGKLRRAAGLNEAGFYPLALVGKQVLVNVGIKNRKDSTDGEMENVLRGYARAD